MKTPLKAPAMVRVHDIDRVGTHPQVGYRPWPVSLALVVACSGAAPATVAPRGRVLNQAEPVAHDASCTPQQAKGSIVDYVPPSLQNVTLDAPRICGGEAYIRFERTVGSRRLGTARSRTGEPTLPES